MSSTISKLNISNDYKKITKGGFQENNCNTLEKKDEEPKIEKSNNNDIKRFLSSFFVLVHVFLFGIIIQIFSSFDQQIIKIAGLSFFTAAVFANIFCTIFKTESIFYFVLSDFLILIGNILLLYFCGLNETFQFESIFTTNPIEIGNRLNESKHILILIFVLMGIAIGFIMNLAPVYISIVCPPDSREFMLNSIGGIGIVSGLTLGRDAIFYVSYGFTVCLILLISLINSFYMVTYGTRQKMEGKLELSKIYDILRNGKTSACLITLCHIANTFSGINYTVFNVNKIYGEHSAMLFFNLLNIFAMICTFMSYKLNFQRKSLLCFSTVICVIANVLFYLFSIKYHKFICFLFIFGFNLGLGTIPFIIIGEIFPIEVIQEGCLIATTANWIGTVFSILAFSDLGNNLFVVANIYLFIFLIYIMTFYKDTKYLKQGQYQ
ncbi:glucose transporter type 1 [Nucleospora cyclopteri]